MDAMSQISHEGVDEQRGIFIPLRSQVKIHHRGIKIGVSHVDDVPKLVEI